MWSGLTLQSALLCNFTRIGRVATGKTEVSPAGNTANPTFAHLHNWSQITFVAVWFIFSNIQTKTQILVWSSLALHPFTLKWKIYFPGYNDRMQSMKWFLVPLRRPWDHNSDSFSADRRNSAANLSWNNGPKRIQPNIRSSKCGTLAVACSACTICDDLLTHLWRVSGLMKF